MTIRLNDHDTHIHVSHVNDSDLLDHLPAHVYLFRQNPLTGEITIHKDRKRFEVPDRKYGKHVAYHRQITSSFDRMGPAVGVIMEGIKGGGKSMLAEDLCNWGITQGLPVFRIDQPLDESALRTIVALSAGHCVLHFDEFGKTYDEEARQGLLSFFADSSLHGVMMILTANSREELSTFMVDRPGRFQYRITFEGLNVDAAREVATSHMLNPAMTEALARLAAYHYEISYDILISMARTASEARTMEKLEEILSITNVPSLVYNYYDITRVVLDGVSYGKDSLQMTMKADTLVLTILSEDGDVLHKDLAIDLLDPKAIHLDTEIEYPSGLFLGNHSLKLDVDDKPMRLLFRRALAERRDCLGVNVPSATAKDKEKEKAQAGK